jgi:hypothetical protein
MRHGRAKDEGVKRGLGRDVVDIPALPGEEPLVLEAPHGLRLAELFHGASAE